MSREQYLVDVECRKRTAQAIVDKLVVPKGDYQEITYERILSVIDDAVEGVIQKKIPRTLAQVYHEGLAGGDWSHFKVHEGALLFVAKYYLEHHPIQEHMYELKSRMAMMADYLEDGVNSMKRVRSWSWGRHYNCAMLRMGSMEAQCNQGRRLLERLKKEPTI